MHGLLILHKPAGWTSHDAVARVRGILDERTVGHLGTLDPLATGVLPLVIGAATRLAQFTEYDKEYETTCLLGRTTDTEDVTGTTLQVRPVEGLDPGRVRRAFQDLVAVKEQVPPMMSAVQKDGVRLYQLARQGKTVERKPRPVSIREVSVLGVEIPRVRFSVVCSQGTYVRTLCRQAGEVLGCGACLESLVRTRVGPFRLSEAVTLEELEKTSKEGGAAGWLKPSWSLVAHLPEVCPEPADLERLCAGNNIATDEAAPGWVRVMNPQGLLCAIAERQGGSLRPRKVFGTEGI